MMIGIEAAVGIVAGLVPGLVDHFAAENIALIGPLSLIEEEPEYQKLKKAGHTFGWVGIGRVRSKKRDGWEPVIERSASGKPTVFMDRNAETLLMSINE